MAIFMCWSEMPMCSIRARQLLPMDGQPWMRLPMVFIGGLTDAYATLSQIIDNNTVIVPISGPLLSKAEFDTQHRSL